MTMVFIPLGDGRIAADNVASPAQTFVSGFGTGVPNATRYIRPGVPGAITAEGLMSFPRAGVLRNFYVYAETPPGGVVTDTLTVRRTTGGVTSDTLIIVALTGTQKAGSDLVNSVSVLAGDGLSVKIVAGASSATANLTWTIEWMPS